MSSSSDEDENLEQFRESLDTQFLKDDLYKKAARDETAIKDDGSVEKPPSLRRNIEEEDQAFNIFRVTPEFQKYVFKHLSAKLEKELKYEEVIDQSVIINRKPKRKGGIKLLHSSQHLIKIPKTNNIIDNELIIIHNEKSRSRIHCKNSDINEEELEANCKSAAVQPEDIYGKKDVVYWTNRPSAKVFCYKKLKNGVMELNGSS